MSKRRSRATVLYWLPVMGLIAALFLAPSSTGAAGTSSLNVTPDVSYGGQELTFSGQMGARRKQTVHLQRRGSSDAAWADVVDPRTGRSFRATTKADGSFRFVFPAIAMNGAQVRLVSRYAATPAHTFQTQHQDADLDIAETKKVVVALPRGLAVRGEEYRIAVDTVNTKNGKPTKPALIGRDVTLQIRNDVSDEWESSGLPAVQVGRDGTLAFGPYGPTALAQHAGVYRVVLEDWTENGDRVGWFPSLPFYLDLVDRPAPVQRLSFPALTSSSIDLAWIVAGADPDRIVIARAVGRDPKAPGDVVASLKGSATSYSDTGLISSTTYRYAVYTVTHYTADGGGVYTELPTRDQATTNPSARGES